MKLCYDVLDHGFVRVVEHETPCIVDGKIENKKCVAVYGSDNAIVQAARTSYGDGTTTVNDDKNLLRYLLRNKHTSPFEMAEIKFHIKLPIFVMRQLVRHRTASLNEISGRYSVLKSEVYLPSLDDIKPQSKDNKQGRSGQYDVEKSSNIQKTIEQCCDDTFSVYFSLLEDMDVARELSRVVLPLNTYTECYWKMDLHNLMHLLRLRMDKHAQLECRVYAEAMYNLTKQFFPITMEAFDDYILQGISLSKMEKEIVKESINIDIFKNIIEKSNISKREKQELLEKFGV